MHPQHFFTNVSCCFCSYLFNLFWFSDYRSSTAANAYSWSLDYMQFIMTARINCRHAVHLLATLVVSFCKFFFWNIGGFQGETVVESAYVRSCCTDAAYFANPLVLGRRGVEKNLGFGQLNAYEMKQLQDAIPILVSNIDAGVKFVIQKADIRPPRKPEKPTPSKSPTKSKC